MPGLSLTPGLTYYASIRGRVITPFVSDLSIPSSLMHIIFTPSPISSLILFPLSSFSFLLFLLSSLPLPHPCPSSSFLAFFSPLSSSATDQVGHKTTITSQGLVTDRTPPSFGRVWLNRLGTVALTTPDGLTPNWDLITDPESDIAGIYWSLGSSQGLGDLIPWTRTNGTAGMLNLTLVDGQSIVLNVMVSGLSLCFD